jgi:aquaporin Z
VLKALKQHWPEYFMEAGELGVFMVSACVFTVILYHPESAVAKLIADPRLRRILVGTAMGATAILIVRSPWGRQSGAHFNPSVTLTFFRLGKIEFWDALFYVVFQFIGAVAGVAIVAVLLGMAAGDPAVLYAATVPGLAGPGVAFTAEFIMALLLMLVILIVSNTERLARYTPFFVASLVVAYISLESPLSGMSVNPARSFGSAVAARLWAGLWIYFTAPPLGMLVAAQIYLGMKDAQSVICAKLDHHNQKRCIFRCGYREAALRSQNASAQVAAVGFQQDSAGQRVARSLAAADLE